MAMLDEGEFPENTLFCDDAGFVGYELWSAMMSKGLITFWCVSVPM